MNDYIRFAICLVVAAMFEFALGEGLEQLPEQKDQRVHKVSITVQERQRVEPEEPKPPPPPPPKPEVKPQAVHEAHPAPQPKQAEQPKPTPPPDEPQPPGPTSDEPVFGVSMESTSQGGTGPVMPVGNTPRPQPKQGSAVAAQDVKPLAEPVAAYEATKMPLPQGNCSGKYNDEALAAGIEGTVVLDLVVGEDGHVRDVQVVQGIGHGLDQAALAALHACHFTPGEKNGQAVPVKIKGFKIRFILPEHE